MLMDRYLAIKEALITTLKENHGEIPWNSFLSGISYAKGLSGYVVGNTVNYSWEDKETVLAEASMDVYILSPIEKEFGKVEALAMAVKNTLLENSDLGGVALNVDVKKIYFAAPAGLKAAGIANIELSIEYEDLDVEENGGNE